MQLTKTLEHYKVRNVAKRFLFFLIVVVLSQVSVFNIKGLFGVSLLPLAFLLGYDFIAIFLIGLISTFNLTMIIIGVGIYLIIESLNLFKLVKTEYLPILVSLLLTGYIYLLYYNFSIVGVSEIITILLLQYTLQVMNLELASFFIHTHSRKIDNKEYTLLLFLLMIGLINLKGFNQNITLIGMYTISLYATYSFGLKSGAFLGIAGTFLMLLCTIGTLYDSIPLLLPIVIFSVVFPKNKLSFIVIYALCQVWIPFLVLEDLKSAVIKAVITMLIFMILPAVKTKTIEVRLSQSALLESERRKMARKISEFGQLFSRITSSFETTVTPVNNKLYVGHFYDKVCKNCTSCDQCFDRYNGNHRLVKLFMKGLEEKLQVNDSKYIQSYCLNAKAYKDQLKIESALYLQQEKINQEYDLLKKNLYHQLGLVSGILNDFETHMSIHCDEQDDYVLNLLRGYHFDVQYLSRMKISSHHDEIDITIRNITGKEVTEELIPLLNKGYNTHYRLVKHGPFKKNGYMHLILENKAIAYMSHGMIQISKDEKYCGDSLSIFENGNKHLYAISDGMGHGKQAHEESSFLLDIFTKLLKTGADVEGCIKTTNALLRIKNKSDMFTTLDLAIFDAHRKEIEFYKNGSMHSFIIREEAIIEIEGRSLPIGIMSDIDAKYEKHELITNDFIVMLSDGVGEIEENQIINYIMDHKDQSAQAIASYFNPILHQASAIDDVTLLILKVED